MYINKGTTSKEEVEKTGIPTIVIGVPACHIHSDSSIIHRDDYDHAVKLIVGLLMKLDDVTVTDFTS